jgi:hypothetical protein
MFNGGFSLMPSFQKILIDVLAIDFIEKEETIDKQTANRMIRNQVTSGLAPFQMFEFYSTFGLRDPSIWGDLSYEDAYRMLELPREKKKRMSTKNLLKR